MKTTVFLIFSMFAPDICIAQMETEFYGCTLSSGQYDLKTKVTTVVWGDTSSLSIDENLHSRLVSFGKLIAEGDLSNIGCDRLILNGKWTQYYPNGNVRSCGNYRRGQPTGLWSYYYGNGHLREQYTIAAIEDTNSNIEYLMAGTYLAFFENGNIKNEGQYIVGYYTGTDSLQLENPETGAITLEVKTTKRLRSKPFGTWLYYNVDGTVEKKEDKKD